MALMVAQAQAVTAQAKLAPLLASATEQAGDAAAIVATLGDLRAVGSTTGAQSVHAVSTLGKLASSLHVQSLNVNTAAIVATLPRLLGRAAATAMGSTQATSRLYGAARGATASAQAMHGQTALSRLRTSSAVTITGVAHLHATLGALAASLHVLPPVPGYAGDGHYYIALAARPFYATLPARPFYAAIRARPFYILSNPDMTPNFDTLDPRETLVLTLDASAELASGETLTAIETLTTTQQSGPTGTAPTLSGQLINAQPVTLVVNGVPVTIAVGAAVQVVATGGTNGCRYLIAATCTTSNPDKVLTLKGVLPVSAL